MEKKYLYRKILVIEIEMSAKEEGSAESIGHCFVRDLLQRGQISAELRNNDVSTYRIYNHNGIDSDVVVNN